MMGEIVRLCLGALFLHTQTFVYLRNSADVFQKGVLVMVVIGLIAGAITSIVDLVTIPTVQGPYREAEQGRDRISETQERLRGYIALGSARAAASLPPTTEGLLKAIGQFVSYPFGWVPSWMLYSFLVLVAARILGGKATVQQMLGCTALAAVPHILDVLGLVPWLGYWPRVVTFIWGLVIYVKGTAVANEFGIDAAVLAVTLPVLGVPSVIAALLLVVLL